MPSEGAIKHFNFANYFFNYQLSKMKTTKSTPKKRMTRQRAKRDRPQDSFENTSASPKKRKFNGSNQRQKEKSPPQIQTPQIDLSSSSSDPQQIDIIQDQRDSNQPSRISSQESSDSDTPVDTIPIHDTEVFKKYLKDVKSKSIQGSWQKFDYETAAKESRYSKVANWLRAEKPKLQHLLYNGRRTGFYKCEECAERGCLHIIKACSSDVSKFKIQNIQKHFSSKAHRESHKSSKLHEFSSEWRKAMDIRYLKIMAKHRVSGGIFKSDEFVDVIMAWVNEVSNTRIDAETIKKEIPSRTTLMRRLDDLIKQVRGELILQLLLKHVETIFVATYFNIFCCNMLQHFFIDYKYFLRKSPASTS